MTNEPTQILLAVYWSKDGTADRFVRYGEVRFSAGDLPVPALTDAEMQRIAYQTKMEFARVMQRRKQQAGKKRSRR